MRGAIKGLGRDDDHSVSYNAGVRMCGAISPLHSMKCCWDQGRIEVVLTPLGLHFWSMDVMQHVANSILTCDIIYCIKLPYKVFGGTFQKVWKT